MARKEELEEPPVPEVQGEACPALKIELVGGGEEEERDSLPMNSETETETATVTTLQEAGEKETARCCERQKNSE